ncbi:MAG: SURF1 family protein [Pseudomonadota bacterium]
MALALVSIAAFAILIGLGTWQLQRLAWKEGLIEAATQRPLATPVPAPGPEAWPTFDIEEWNYRRVLLTGTFGEDEAHTWIVLSDPKGPLSGPGYFVVAPFTTSEGWSVLVNRGFVPEDQKAQSARAGSAPPSGEVTIEGLIRRDDTPSFITPAPNERTNTWFSRHISGMAPYLGLKRALTAPYTVDLTAEATPASGVPQAGESKLTFSNNHLQYALTWYGLAAALVGVFAVSLWPWRREKS